MLNKSQLQMITAFQKAEITEHFIYSKLANSTKDKKNKSILEHISKDELNHYNFWKKYTNINLKPNLWTVWLYFLVSKLFGLTFGIKLMEHGEKKAQQNYSEISKLIVNVKNIVKDEHAHEKKLIELLQEEKLHYVGSIVLGLNDALVELTGALAGFTFALSSGKVVALAGLITGIAASLSMAASEYQSRRSEKNTFKEAFKSSTYTGIAYFITVVLLVLPYFLLPSVYMALGCTLAVAILIILIFTFYTSVAQELPFRRRFLEMAITSFGVAAISFGIGVVVKLIWGI